MKKNGFTMIELLAVFTITALILLMTVPLVTGMLKKGNDESYQRFLDDVFLATEAYITEDNIVVSKTEYTSIRIEDLVASGYLKSTNINPKNKKEVISDINKNKIVKVKKNELGVLEYILED